MRLEGDQGGGGDEHGQRHPDRPAGVVTLVARIVRSEHVAVRHQRADEVGDVEDQEHDRDADAQVLVDAGGLGLRGQVAAGVVEHRRQQEGDDDEDEQAGEPACLVAVEALPAPADAADDDGQAEAEQAGADDGAGDLGAHDVGVAGGENEERQDDLGEAAEAHVEQAADGRADSRGQVLGGPADPVREHADRQCTGDEDPQSGERREVVERRRDRNDEQQGERQPQAFWHERARSSTLEDGAGAP